ncbi:MAG: hypothetical protein RSI32_08815, partial [Clostridia bacterium]
TVSKSRATLRRAAYTQPPNPAPQPPRAKRAVMGAGQSPANPAPQPPRTKRVVTGAGQSPACLFAP